MSRHRVVRTIARPDADTVAGLADAGVSTVHEAQGRRGAFATAIRPIQRDARVAGPAVTVSCQAGDNLMLHAAVEVCRPGDLLVVTTTSPSTDGMLGELLATSLAAHGVIGVVLDAGVRDVAELRAMGFPVWARAISPQGTVKASPGSVNVPVVCAGQAVSPGDVVVADDDGVVVVPREDAATVLAAARKRQASETAKRARLGAGELGVDMYDLRPLLARLGVGYEDEDTEHGTP
jgi:4-hydroxy-4-methyl-2-oxoglutarate aldolase